MDGNSSAHAAAAVFNVYFLNSLKRMSSSHKGQRNNHSEDMCSPSDQSSTNRIDCSWLVDFSWLVYQIISELYNSTGNFITLARFWVEQRNVGYWSGLVGPKFCLGAHCDNHNRLKNCAMIRKCDIWSAVRWPCYVCDINCPISKNVFVLTPRLSLLSFLH